MDSSAILEQAANKSFAEDLFLSLIPLPQDVQFQRVHKLATIHRVILKQN
jgi:hypothetical protein